MCSKLSKQRQSFQQSDKNIMLALFLFKVANVYRNPVLFNCRGLLFFCAPTVNLNWVEDSWMFLRLVNPCNKSVKQFGHNNNGLMNLEYGIRLRIYLFAEIKHHTRYN